MKKIIRLFLITCSMIIVYTINVFAVRVATPSELGEMNRFIKEYEKNIGSATKNGIEMTVANDRKTLQEFLETLAPDNSENIEFSVFITDKDSPTPGKTTPAIAGNRLNPAGVKGIATFKIYVWDQSIWHSQSSFLGEFEILPIKYNVNSYGDIGDSSSSEGDSSSEGYFSVSKQLGMQIKEDSIFEGKWERKGENWRLQQLDGRYAKAQWAYIDNKWYLFDDSSNMCIGWQLVDGEWYYLNLNGEMETGWILWNGNWYCLDSSGRMLKGWQWLEGKCYFFDSNGAMWYDTTTPDGYQVDINGAWVL